MYEVGQKVRVKSWEQMEREYGSTDGAINTPSFFTADMRRFCGMVFTISYVDYSSYITYDIEARNNKTLSDELEDYWWDEEMFEPTGSLAEIIQRRKENV